jgi:hypothetical protein
MLIWIIVEAVEKSDDTNTPGTCYDYSVININNKYINDIFCCELSSSKSCCLLGYTYQLSVATLNH